MVMDFLKKIFSDAPPNQSPIDITIVEPNLVNIIEEAGVNNPLSMDEIMWGNDESELENDWKNFLNELVIDTNDDDPVKERRAIQIAPEHRINFTVWQVEQNVEAAQLFFVNLRRNLPGMVKESFGGEASLRYSDSYYLSGEYVDIQDYMRATKKWGVPVAIHSPGRHAALVLKTPEYDESLDQWKVLVYDPISGGHTYRWLDKDASSNEVTADDHLVSILDIQREVNQDDPKSDPMRYGLLVNADNEQLMSLWNSGQYDLSVSTDIPHTRALNEGIVAMKEQKVQFDLNNCVLASGFMGVVRAFLKYPDLFDIKKRADLYKDTGIIFYLRDEVLRRVDPPSVEELVANGGAGN